MWLPNLKRGTTNTRKSLRNHTVPTPLANIGRKVIPMKMAQFSLFQEVLGGQMLRGPSHVAGGRVGVCWTLNWLLKDQGRNRSTSLGAEFWVTRLISYP